LKKGSSTGSDYAGDVVEVGKNVKNWKVGDAASGFTRGGMMDSANGAFQEYIRSPAALAWHVDTNVLSYEDAAGMGGIALSTAQYALFHILKLPTPWARAREPKFVLIWSGATSVGIYAIRLAKLAGLKIASTSSPSNFELLKHLGADVVFDYHDAEAPKKIKEWSGGKISQALDTISEKGSTESAAEAFGSEGGSIATLLPVEPKGTGPLGKTVQPITVLIYSAQDPKNKADYTNLTDWNTRVPTYAKELKVMPLQHWDGGLEGIPAALDHLKSGEVSASKISLTF